MTTLSVSGRNTDVIWWAGCHLHFYWRWDLAVTDIPYINVCFFKLIMRVRLKLRAVVSRVVEDVQFRDVIRCYKFPISLLLRRNVRNLGKVPPRLPPISGFSIWRLNLSYLLCMPTGLHTKTQHFVVVVAQLYICIYRVAPRHKHGLFATRSVFSVRYEFNLLKKNHVNIMLESAIMCIL